MNVSQDSPAIIVEISLRNFLLMQFEVNISAIHCRWLYFFIFLRRPLLLVDGPDLSGRLIEKGAVWWIEVRHVMQLLSIIETDCCKKTTFRVRLDTAEN